MFIAPLSTNIIGASISIFNDNSHNTIRLASNGTVDLIAYHVLDDMQI
jgi:hypothetical protein